jgi:hypothetical protein
LKNRELTVLRKAYMFVLSRADGVQEARKILRGLDNRAAKAALERFSRGHRIHGMNDIKRGINILESRVK